MILKSHHQAFEERLLLHLSIIIALHYMFLSYYILLEIFI